jgi:hypothetical protein
VHGASIGGHNVLRHWVRRLELALAEAAAPPQTLRAAFQVFHDKNSISD